MDLKNAHYHILSGLVILCFLGAGLFTLPDYGMGWDEVTRWQSGDLKIEYYQQLFSGNAGSFRDQMTNDRYPGLFDMTLSILHKIMGGDRMLQGHGLSLVFGCIGLYATAWLATIVFGAKIAFLSTLILAVFPNFYGHAMINPKDISFLAMYTLGLGTVLAVTKNLLQHRKVPIGRYVWCGGIIGLAAACRVPGMILIAFAAVSWSAAILWKGTARANRPELVKQASHLVEGVTLTAIMAFLVLLIFFPRMHGDLLFGVSRVSSTLHSSASEIPLLFAGEVMDAGEGPRTYAHGFFLISTPVWMLILLVIGGAFLVHQLMVSPRGRRVQFPLELIFCLFALFPWVYILVFQTALHNGIRHMLWGIPPLVIIMGLAGVSLENLLRVRTIGRMWLAIPLSLLLLGSLQIVNLVRMHPYQYVSFNFLAGERSTIPNRYETEYWFTSTRHLLEALPAVANRPDDYGGPIKIRVAGPLNAADPFLPMGFVLVYSFEEADYYLSNTTFRTDLLAEGESVYEILKGGIPIGVIKRLSP